MTARVGAAVPAVFHPPSAADFTAQRFSPNVAFYVSFHSSPSSSLTSSRISALRKGRRPSRRSVEAREGNFFVYGSDKEPARGYEQSKSCQNASGRNVRFTRAHVQEESFVSRLTISSASLNNEDGHKLTLRRPILEPPCDLVDMRTNFMHNTTEALEDAHGRVSWRQPQVNARVSASLDSDEGKTDGARRALEQMFQGKTNIGKKLEEEIMKRELQGSDGSGGGGRGGGGRGWGGGAGDGDMDEDFGGQDEPWDWGEVGETFMATFALIILYFSITHGPKQVFRLFRLFFRWVRQGFTLRAIPWEYLEPGPDDVHTEDEEEELDREFNEERVLRREMDDTPQQSNARDNYDGAEESEDEDFDLPPPPMQKKENRMAAMQAQQKEKLLQMLTPKERREKERRDKEDK